VLARAAGFEALWSISVNPTDGSCWVADLGSNQVVHLAADGAELMRAGGFNEPYSVSVNPTDGSCWVADSRAGEPGHEWGQVVHLAADGTELWRGGGYPSSSDHHPQSVCVNPTDGSCWVVYQSDVVHLAENGTRLGRVHRANYSGYSVSVNPTDGSCWVADTGHSQVAHLVILPTLAVSIDVKPGSYPNAVNLGSQGVIPVAILSSDTFDAAQVDPTTISLGGAGVAIRGRGKYLANEDDVNGDGRLDLVVQVDTENLDPGEVQDGYVWLTGYAYGDELFEGWDDITVVPPQ